MNGPLGHIYSRHKFSHVDNFGNPAPPVPETRKADSFPKDAGNWSQKTQCENYCLL